MSFGLGLVLRVAGSGFGSNGGSGFAAGGVVSGGGMGSIAPGGAYVHFVAGSLLKTWQIYFSG
jgi:hypothetical protein